MSWFLIIGVGGVFLIAVVLYLSNRTNGSIRSNGRIRRYLLYVPDSYDPELPAPLVISVHGFVQWPAHQQRLSGWNKLAEEFGFLVVYPRGTGFPLRWHAGPFSDHSQKSKDDLAFFTDLIDHLCQIYQIDQSRVYVNGMSNGGGMAHLLACKLPGRIAAFGGVAGAYLYPGDRYQPYHPVPWIVFHGVQDPIVPFRGGVSRRRNHEIQFPDIEAWCEKWAAYNGCDGSPDKEEISQEITCTAYKSCEKKAEVVLYIIQNAGHTWPGGGWLPHWLTGSINREIDATALMWEFYQKYRLPDKKHR